MVEPYGIGIALLAPVGEDAGKAKEVAAGTQDPLLHVEICGGEVE